MRSFLFLLFSWMTLGCNPDPKEAAKPKTANYVTTLEAIKKIEVGDGETVYQAEGKDHGHNMCFVITETKPGGGPPLHTHPTEEAHIVLSGKVTYFIADSIFTVTAPYIVHIPANTAHTFINSGDTVLNLIGAFAEDSYGPYKPIGRNPLIK